MEKVIYLISHEHNMEYADFVVGGKLLAPGRIVNSLLTKTALKHAIALNGKVFIYSPRFGVYFFHDERNLTADLGRIFRSLNLHDYVRKSVLSEIVWQISTFLPQDKAINYNYLTFKNGHLNLDTEELVPLGPEIISVSYIDVEFNRDVEPTKFQAMLNLQFEPETQNFLKAFIWSVLKGDTRSHTFLYLYGPGGTGKSILTNILAMLVGEEATLTTTIRDLQNDKFEGANIVWKRLICINDTEVFKGDLSTLKALTGGDSLMGRIKHESGSFQVRSRGRLVISGNHLLQSRDSSGALDRRMRMLPMEKRPNKVEPLLYMINGKWEGPLVAECPGIVRWARMDNSLALETLQGSLPPQMEKLRVEAHNALNPLIKWVSEDLERSEEGGAYIGCNPDSRIPEKVLLDARKHRTLYPSYLLYCHKQRIKPLNHNRFTQELVLTCQTMDIPIRSARHSTGRYIHGLTVNPKSLTAEALAGSPMTSTRALEEPELADLSSFYDVVDPNLYKDYINLLTKERPVLRHKLNTVGSTSFLAFTKLDELVSEHADLCSGLKGLKVTGLDYDFGNPSKDYRNHYKKIFEQSLGKIEKNGLIPRNYKELGLSPRIIPMKYGENFNSVKKFLRFKAYEFVIKRFPGYTILDVDLKSCYTSILLGLFPQKLYKIRQAIEGPGLWKTMEEQFIESGKETLFNKPAVKICLYSSFFGGGPTAMINGTMEFFRKEIGRTQDEFRKAKYYEALHALARDVSEFVNGTEIIQDFRDVSGFLMKTYMGKSLRGPTGHTYSIRDAEEFRSSYPNFLQSFEFFLLAKATILTHQQMGEFILIGHFHDGNVVYLPTDKVSLFEETMNANLDKLKNELRLYYPQTIEIKRFDSSSSET